MKKKQDKKTGTPEVLTLYDMLLRLVVQSDLLNGEVFATFERRLRVFFAEERNAEIRLFFGFSRNLGHRATTIGIMNRLITYFPAGSNRTIRLIYDVDPEDEDGPSRVVARQEFANAMALLVPGLTAQGVLDATPYALTNRVTLQFNCFDQREEVPFLPALDTDCYFAVTGGYDDTLNITETIRVQCILVLEPYQFTKYNSLNTVYFQDTAAAHGILLGPKYNREGTEVVDNLVGYYGLTFTRRAYYLPDPVVSGAEWQLFQNGDAYRYSIVQRLMTLREAGSIQIMPCYYSDGRIMCSSRELLFNMTSALFEMQRLRTVGRVPNVCSVIVVLGGIEDADYAAVLNLVNVGIPRYPLLSARGYALRNAYRDRYNALGINATPQNITDAVAAVGNSGIVVVRLGKVPLYINNYLFSVLSALPAVYEGEGSASMILNSGKPFLHLISRDLNNIAEGPDRDAAILTNQLYPTIPLNAESSPIANRCHIDSLSMVSTFQQWETGYEQDVLASSPDEIVGNFIYDSYRAGSDRYNYFATLRPFFNSPLQDKLMLGMIYTLGEINGRAEETTKALALQKTP